MEAAVPVYRHSAITRITHGAFGIAFFGLALTGTQFLFHARWIRNPLLIHEILAGVTIASGLVYFGHALLTGRLRSLLFGARDIRGLVPMTLYYLRLRATPPEYAEYNPLQKLAYTAVLLMLAPLIVATGLAIWPHLALFRPIANVFGGRRATSVWHLGFALELLLFFAGHMVMVATTGLRQNLRAIVTGWSTPVMQPMPVESPSRRRTARLQTGIVSAARRARS